LFLEKIEEVTFKGLELRKKNELALIFCDYLIITTVFGPRNLRTGSVLTRDDIETGTFS